MLCHYFIWEIIIVIDIIAIIIAIALRNVFVVFVVWNVVLQEIGFTVWYSGF